MSCKVDVPVYCINLDRCKKRKDIMTKEFNHHGIEHRFISAIDGTQMDPAIQNIDDEFRKTHVYTGTQQGIPYSINLQSFPSDYILNTSNGHKLTIDFAIATVFSHVKAIKTAYDNNLEHVIIAEDDITFLYLDKLNKSITEIIKEAPNNWNCIKLHSSNINSITHIIQGDKQNRPFICWDPNFMSGGFYLLNRKGMEAILNHFYVEDKYTIINEQSLAADVILFRHITDVYLYTKMFVINNNAFFDIESEINPSDWRKKLELDGILLSVNYIENLQHIEHDYPPEDKNFFSTNINNPNNSSNQNNTASEMTLSLHEEANKNTTNNEFQIKGGDSDLSDFDKLYKK
jgi:GR25 family glycosyltransferase involved in LPS biosynthesis